MDSGPYKIVWGFGRCRSLLGLLFAARILPATLPGLRLAALSFNCSLDGKRLYVTNSLFSPWDKQVRRGVPGGGVVAGRVRPRIREPRQATAPM